MADFVFIRKSRNTLSSFLHVILNIILAVGSIYITFITGNPLPGLLLVLLSKWRMFAVRPRYWFLNLKSNLVDIIVGASFVLIAYCTGTKFMPMHVILSILYTLWLVVLKPKSNELATNLQALSAVFFGTTALVLLTATLDSAVLLVGSFIIGYGAARHVLVQGNSHNYELVMLLAGLVSAEVAWLCHAWLIVYSFAGTGIVIPQLSIILVILSYVFGFIYRSITKNENKVNWQEIIIPIIFSASLITIIVIWFSKPIFNI
jgi:hypothetical protein